MPPRRPTPWPWPTGSCRPPASAAVGAYVAGLGIAVGPVHGLELLRGLAKAGLVQDMVRTLTDTATPGWAHIVASGGTFTWETWTPSDLIGDSMSHGWGSSALVAMQESLLGVTLQAPAEDGAVLAAIIPPKAGLTRGPGYGPDHRRTDHGLVEPGSNGALARRRRPGQCFGPDHAPRRGNGVGAGGWRPTRPRVRRDAGVRSRRRGGARRQQRLIPFHLRHRLSQPDLRLTKCRWSRGRAHRHRPDMSGRRTGRRHCRSRPRGRCRLWSGDRPG